MKKIFTLLSFILLISSCTTRDEDSYYQKTINLNKDNYINVYTQNTYNVGDNLFIESIFNKLQDEPGFSNKLDLFRTTNSREFNFYFTLEKKVFNGNYTIINLLASDFTTGGLGSVIDNLAFCELNINNTQYEFYKGLKLQEAGEYRLTIQPNISNFNNYYANENVNIQINTTIENVIGNTYEFTVN